MKPGACRALGRVACVALCCGPAVAVEALRVEASEPRAYGYQVGELVQRHISVDAPPGWRLVQDSLPRPGGRGQAIELRRVAATVRDVPAGQRHELALEYQVFLAPPSVRTLEIAPLRLRFEHPTRSEEVRVEAWPVTVAPLTPLEVSQRRGLGELQPDRPPPLIDTAPMRARLLACAVLAQLLLLALSLLSFGPAWRAARNRPFGRAWRELRRLPAHPPQAQWRAACRTMHEALNRSAGEVLFEPGLERFFAAQPAFRGVRDEIAKFMQSSRDEFFDDTSHADVDASGLVSLCRRCRDVERGLG
ncbi:MAG: hypothetical protein WA210_19840 [Burkholderiaceae bacterium]